MGFFPLLKMRWLPGAVTTEWLSALCHRQSLVLAVSSCNKVDLIVCLQAVHESNSSPKKRCSCKEEQAKWYGA